MTTLDRLLKEHVEELLKEARPDQIRRLLADIGLPEHAPAPTPTHHSTDRLQ